MGAAAARLTGYGDYVTNSLIKDTNLDQNSIPKFGSSKTGTRITHSEYLGDITSTTAFTVANYTINPANAATFPWLSTIAGNFEKYRFRGLVFSYRTLSSEYNASSQSLGAVIAAAQYDVYDPPFASKQIMENYATAVSTKPSNSLFFGVECKPSSTACPELYIRNQPNSTLGDNRMYDLATFAIATQGMPNSYTAGELWVSYDIDLFYPNINYSLNYYANEVLHLSSSVNSTTYPWSALNTKYSNLVGSVSNNGVYPYTQNWSASNNFFLPEYYGSGAIQVAIFARCSASSAAAGNMGLNNLVNLSPLNAMVTNNNNYATGFPSTTGAQMQAFVGLYQINNPTPSQPRAGFNVNIIWPGTTTVTSVEMIITWLPSNFT